MARPTTSVPAKQLIGHARSVAAVLSNRSRAGLSTLGAVAVAKTMVDLAEQVLHDTVNQARDEGHTWNEIGEVLGTSRQAAFQRFNPEGARSG